MLIEFPYLLEHETEVEEEVQRLKEETELRQDWQKRILGPDVYGLGAGKPSMLDHLMTTDVRRYAPVTIGPLSRKKLDDNRKKLDEGQQLLEELD